jgi:hypothetical protein
MSIPIVLIHGYSDEGASFRAWARELAADRDASLVHTCSYESLTNEVTIRDIAEGFDRALRIRAGLDNGEPFDAIVHSTGMLVIRAWLTGDRERRVPRLKHLVGLESLWMRVIASSGSRIVGYRGEGSEKMIGEGADMRMVEDGKWDAAINLTPTLHPAGEGGPTGPVSVFYPFTTTLIELKLNREPLPPMGPNRVLWFEGQRAT